MYGAQRVWGCMCLQEGVEWSLQEAKRQGLTAGSHFCDYLLFLDADQVTPHSLGLPAIL